MASQSIPQAPWAPGTTVSVYTASSIPAGVDAPIGSAVATAMVDETQSITFSGLSEGIRYAAYAGGITKRFLIPFSTGDPVDALRGHVLGLEADVGLARASDRQQPRYDISTGKIAWRNGITADIRDFGAIGDGTAHPLSEKFSTLLAAQVVYPWVTSLSQTLDCSAVIAAMEYVGARGGGRVLVADTGHNYIFAAADARTVDTTKCYLHRRHDNVVIEGQGPGSSGLYAGTTNSQAVLCFERKFSTLFGTGSVAFRPEAATAYTLATPTVGTGDTSSGTYTILNAAVSTGTWKKGQRIAGTNIAADTSIVSVSGSTLTLTKPTTGTGTGVALTGGYRPGESSITTATPADAGNFAAGDVVFIKTGQTLATTVTEPDSEMNIVVSANASTGVVLLHKPLAKPYSQEYFISGTTGLTSTVSTANPAPFAVAKINDRVLRNVGFVNFNATNLDTLRGIGNGDTILGYKRTGCNFTVAAYLFSQSVLSEVIDKDNIAVDVGTGGTINAFCYAYGSTDIEASGNILTSEQRVFFWHVHEGVARYKIHHNTTNCGDALSTTNAPNVSIRARSYGGKIDDNTFVNSSTGAGSNCIYVDPDCTGGGEIDGNEFRGNHNADVVSVSCTGWKIGSRNRLPLGSGVTIFNGGSRRADEVQTFSAWVADDQQRVVLGTLPPDHKVLSVDQIHVTEAFNGSVSNTIAVGIQGVSVNAYGTATDVTTTGQKTVTQGSSIGGYSSSERVIEALYVSGGTAPTTGKALVTVRWVRAPRQVA